MWKAGGSNPVRRLAPPQDNPPPLGCFAPPATGYQKRMGVKEAATEQVKDAVKDRVAGKRPSVLRALLIALIVGIAAAVITYKLLRS